ncbi:hypothetical protein ID866_12708 [Astraeus odoratus]|nr:hypothetical protein ID866_12708 [Astraeus odoratus]
MISREQSYLSPDVDSVRDVLQSQLVNVYQHGVLTAREFVQADHLAAKTTQPRAMLEALRVALLRGLDIVDALKASAR